MRRINWSDFLSSLDSIQQELSESSQKSLLDETNNFQNRQLRRKWKKVIHRDIKIAIFSSSFKKELGPDKISFLILQKLYHAISDLFDMIFYELIKNEYHLQCWKKSIEAILKKLNKVNYSQSKAYSIISLLNCLRKISKKIIAIRLSHFAEHSNLLHNEQMKERKNRSAIDASLCLVHDIQTTKNSKNVFSCLFLNVKEGFNHVSTDRLIAILYKLKMSYQLIRWIKSFINNRKIELAFNEKKQAARAIRTEIQQRSSISPILFSIYIRFLFSEIKNEDKYASIKMSNFIDHVAIEVESKSAKENLQFTNWNRSKSIFLGWSKRSKIRWWKIRTNSFRIIE